jgi:hypothetical protein
MIKNTIQLMNDAKVIAQQNAPFQTGNLRYNAIRAYPTPQGFRVVMLFTVAFYGAILDKTKNKKSGWWSVSTLSDITTYVDAVLNNKQSNIQVDHAGVAKFAADDPARKARFYNSMIGDEGRALFAQKYGSTS